MRLKDLKEAVGQILILGIDGTELAGAAEKLITELQPAGLILFAPKPRKR